MDDGSERFFASFLSRNRCYDLLQSLWRPKSVTASVTDIVEPPPIIAADTPMALSDTGSVADLDAALAGTAWAQPGLEFQEIGVVELPIATSAVFAQFFADTATAYSMARHYAALGATQVVVGPWQQGVRRISLFMPIANPLAGVRATRVEETCHGLFDSATASFHYRTQSASLDVPYGDAFCVLLSYDVTPAADSAGCVVRGRAALQFTRTVWGIKSLIVAQTLEGVRQSFRTWASAAAASVTAQGSAEQIAPELPPGKPRTPSRTAPRSTAPRFPGIPWRAMGDFLGQYDAALLALLLVVVAAGGLLPARSATVWGPDPADFLLQLPDLVLRRWDDLCLAEIYASALLTRLRMGQEALPGEVRTAVAHLNDVLRDWLRIDTDEDRRALLTQLHELRIAPRVGNDVGRPRQPGCWLRSSHHLKKA